MNMHFFTDTIARNHNPTVVGATPVTLLKNLVLERIGAVRARLARRTARRIDRQAFAHMLRLDDRTLEDIGVTRDAVLRANKLPLAKNAALELARMSHTNRQQGIGALRAKKR